MVQARPGQERRARGSLVDAGLVAYLPVCAPPPARREVALFPSYLFMTWPGDEAWPAVRSAKGVARLLTTGQQPSRVRAGFVEAIMASEVGGLVPLPEPEAPRQFGQGDRVRIAAGTWHGRVGVVEWAKAGGRVSVLIEAMGRVLPVRTGQGSLEAA